MLFTYDVTRINTLLCNYILSYNDISKILPNILRGIRLDIYEIYFKRSMSLLTELLNFIYVLDTLFCELLKFV